MKKNNFSFDVVFFLIVAGELSSHVFHLQALHFIFKPLLLVWLSVYFYSFARDNFNSYAKFIQTGFFFSWVGDVFLMFDEGNEIFFLFGLCSFLLTHLCYIIAFLNSVKGKKSFLKKNWFYALPFAAAGIVNVIMLYPKLGALAIPVAIYGTAIITMVLCALNRKDAVSPKSFWLVFSGALLFMISDSTLSANKFIMEIPNAELLVMATYISAQYLIMRGSLVYLNIRNSTNAASF